MSDRPSERGPLNISTRDEDSEIKYVPVSSPPPDHAGPHPGSGVRSVTSPSTQRQVQTTGRFELPPLPQAPTGMGGSFPSPAPRSGAVSSILNPPQAEAPESSRRRKAPQLESPASSIQSLPPIVTSAQASQAIRHLPTASPGIQHAAPTDRAPRRILTPRSPSLHRVASLSQLNPSAGTINAQMNPFPASPRSRVYTVEPGTSGAPPLPTPPTAGMRPGYGFSARTPPSEAARRASTGVTHSRALSSSASPSTSYSSYSQAGPLSPSSQYAPMSMATLSAPYTGAGDFSLSGYDGAGGPPSTIRPLHQRPMGIPISSSGGQNAYQMMTVDTGSGPVQLPVDVQAASRVADEKRRRNAGASARFRERRKIKEKEAATSIARLDQQAKDLTEDMEFYRRERDNLAQILQSFPGGSHHFPRPTSPRHRRATGAHLAGQSGTGSIGYHPDQEHNSRRTEEGRNVRRRTSTFSLPPPPPQPQPPTPGVAIQPNQGPLAPQAPFATPQSSAAPLPPLYTRGPLPTLSQMSPEQLQRQHPYLPPPPVHPGQAGPPQVMQTLPETGPWNPYAPDRRTSVPNNPPPRDGR